MVFPDPTDRMEVQDNPASLDPLDYPDKMVSPAEKETLVHQAPQALLDSQAHKVLLVFPDLQVHPVQKETLVKMAFQDPLASKD